MIAVQAPSPFASSHANLMFDPIQIPIQIVMLAEIRSKKRGEEREGEMRNQICWDPLCAEKGTLSHLHDWRRNRWITTSFWICKRSLVRFLLLIPSYTTEIAA